MRTYDLSLSFRAPVGDGTLAAQAYSSSVAAGFPSPASEFAAKRIDVMERLVVHPQATFIMRVSGESMREAGIFVGDVILVDRALKPQHGRIVVAIIERARSIRARVNQWIGIPTCVGIAPTKTLAKLANHVAKQAERKPGSYPADLAQVCDLSRLSPGALQDILGRTNVGEVWGVGRRIAAQLKAQGVETALDLSRMSPSMARSGWSVIFERTVRELQGEACMDLET